MNDYDLKVNSETGEVSRTPVGPTGPVLGSGLRVAGPTTEEWEPEPTMEVTIRFPANWMPQIELSAYDALHGHDGYWLKQIMAKIVIAAMPANPLNT